MAPEISVIIPCFNRERYIAEAIETALAQGDIAEVIVVDDGSHDRSWEIIDSFEQVRSKRIPNRGPSAARNAGLSMARAPYVKFQDSDDRLPAGALAGLLNEASKVQSHQILFGDARVIDERGDPTSGPGYGYPTSQAGAISNELLLLNTMPLWLPLFPLRAIQRVGGLNESLSVSEDYELAARLAAGGYEFVHHSLVACEVREHTGPRASRDYGAAGYRCQLEALSLAAQAAAALPEKALLSVAKVAWRLGRAASRERHREEAESLFRFADQLAGQEAYVAHPLLCAAYRVATPYFVERAAEAVKVFRR